MRRNNHTHVRRLHSGPNTGPCPLLRLDMCNAKSTTRRIPVGDASPLFRVSCDLEGQAMTQSNNCGMAFTRVCAHAPSTGPQDTLTVVDVVLIASFSPGLSFSALDGFSNVRRTGAARASGGQLAVPLSFQMALWP